MSTMLDKTIRHPCFNGCGGKFSRIHLPVAPACNLQCNYCVRKFDCPNESRPGVCASVLSPAEALKRYHQVKQEVRNLTVVGIAGPGDTLANFDQTREVFRLIREEDPDVTLCLSTNGLLLPDYVDDLAALGLSHLTVTINAVDPEIGREIITYADYRGKRLTGKTAAQVLLDNQLEGLRLAAKAGFICKVNTVMLKGINEDHLPRVIETVKNYGASLTNIMQLIPVKESVFQDMPLVDNQELQAMRKRCETILPQMYHCRQCRADAIGPLHQDVSCLYTKQEDKAPLFMIPEASPDKNQKDEEAGFQDKPLLFAIASKNGKLVDQHFGHAEEFYIYRLDNDQISFVEKRSIHQFCGEKSGCFDHDDKISALVEAFEDCTAIISLRIGDAPRMSFEARGIRVFMTYSKIEDAVKAAAEQCKTGRKEILLSVV